MGVGAPGFRWLLGSRYQTSRGTRAASYSTPDVCRHGHGGVRPAHPPRVRSRPARRSEGEALRRATSSHRKRSRSSDSRAMVSRTGRSAQSSSSAPAPSSGISARCTRSSESALVENFGQRPRSSGLLVGLVARAGSASRFPGPIPCDTVHAHALLCVSDQLHRPSDTLRHPPERAHPPALRRRELGHGCQPQCGRRRDGRTRLEDSS